jgi:hypothetical protein
LIDDQLAHFEDAEWTLTPAPNLRYASEPVGNTRDFLAYVPLATAQPVTIDRDTGRWTLHAICSDRDAVTLYTPVVEAAGSRWIVSNEVANSLPSSWSGPIRIARLDW